MLRSLLITILCALTISSTACFRTDRGDWAPAVAPLIHESYVISGHVRSAGLVDKALPDIRVFVISHKVEIGPVVTDLDGRFSIRVERTPLREGSGTTVNAGVVIEGKHDLVTHPVGAVSRGHDHWEVKIEVREEGYRPAALTVEVPRDVRLPPLKLAVLPLNP
ncbi:MAG: hypothetical protein GY811_26400 [Myxococcales bacterium]|nr:hypothetical protein [Myxococcales bacterium]